MSMTRAFTVVQPLRSRAGGFTLVEVLVAVLVIAIGLIGIAALQTVSIRYNHSAALRYQATLLSYDILDRMRANGRYARNSTGYRIAMEETATAGSCESSTTAATATSASVCNEDAVATTDLARWKSALQTSLPQGDGSIEIQDTANGRLCIVTVKWDDSRGKEPPQQLVMRSML